MSRTLTVFLALLLLGGGLPPSKLAAEEIPATPPAVVSEELEASPPMPETSADGSSGEGEKPPAEASAEPAQPRKEPTVDAVHRKISSGVVATARWLDSFFADPRVENEVGESRVRVRFSLFAEEDEPLEYDVRANIRLDLLGDHSRRSGRNFLRRQLRRGKTAAEQQERQKNGECS
jgi:hypothetical protein